MAISTRLFTILVISICVVHVMIRAYDLDRESLDFDEAMTWNHTQSVKGVFLQTLLDIHPPLYFLCLSSWRQWAGSSESALRAPSVVFSLFTLLTLMVFGRSIHAEAGRLNALIVGLLFCLLPYDIFLSRFARSWTMAMFLCSLHSYLYLKATKESEIRLFIGSCVVGLLAVYTHYIAALPIASTMLAATMTNPNRRNLLCAGTSLAAMAIIFAPWAVVLPIQMVIKAGCPHFTTIRDSSAEAFLSLMNPGRYSLEDSYLRSRGPLYLMGLGVSAAAVGLVLSRFRRLLKVDWTRALLLQVLFTILLLAVSPTPLLNEKTLCVMLAPVLLLLAFCLTDNCLRRMQLSSIVSIGFICAFCGVSLAGFPYPSERSGWREVCRNVTAQCNTLDHPLVLLSHTEEILPLEYQQTRHEGTHMNELWIPLNSVGTMHSPYDRLWRLHTVDDPPPTISGAEWGPVQEAALVWVANHLFQTHPDISDILYVRKGSGDLFNQPLPGPVNLTYQANVARFTMSRIGRFSAHVVYHMRALKAESQRPRSPDPLHELAGREDRRSSAHKAAAEDSSTR